MRPDLQLEIIDLQLLVRQLFRQDFLLQSLQGGSHLIEAFVGIREF